MKVAAYQMPVRACYGPDAVAHLGARVRECERAGVDLLCCPEGALGGLADYVDAPDDIAMPADLDVIATQLRGLLSQRVSVVVGFTERDASGRYYNAAAVCSGGAVVGIYRKHHPAIRRSRYSPGTAASVFQVGGVTIGVLICRDSTDVQLARTLIDQGAQMLCIPTNNAMPPSRGGAQLIAEVRALDARLAATLGVPVIRADVVGEVHGLASAGASMITQSSTRQCAARGEEGGELLVAEVSIVGDALRDVDISVAAG